MRAASALIVALAVAIALARSGAQPPASDADTRAQGHASGRSYRRRVYPYEVGDSTSCLVGNARPPQRSGHHLRQRRALATCSSVLRPRAHQQE
ncbi:MAG: hypothetical protein ACLS37_11130 [Alistipes sp.]